MVPTLRFLCIGLPLLLREVASLSTICRRPSFLTPRSYRSFSRYASTNPETMQQEWYSCEIVANEKDAESLRNIRIQAGAPLADLYLQPGQYVKIKIGDGKPSFFAIASPPSANSQEFSFLVKEADSNAALTSLASGAKVDVSIPMGKGFQIEQYLDRYQSDFPSINLLLFACGAGLAPIAAAIDSGKLGLKTTGYMSLYERTATLYIGAKSPKHLPFSHRYEEWKSKGVSIVPVISRPNLPESCDWTGRTGYIQDALKEDGVNRPKNSAALLCGMRGMTDNVKELLLDAGVFEGRVLFNF